MADICIRRTAESEYKLIVDGSEVKIYDQTKMKHPWDWADDAKAAGATEADIRSRNYDYEDVRFDS